ncbi:MFS-type transporter involved in bile tolerance, Atg22 family [Humidesulfovibrio mexicanus]|uniref:MFS-type transporter involved in bile tolerance, Atg22 family n=1 Tax=Humidesulfovibrio mexicanus TaxID=147047 RepID=A0A238ZB78_9BACT|nr:MFS transporter [Humidesulfovibrio mexicanus]SNR80228.1 MFS-type transporter involved in bile tolerance, Atg22 family [Humidesulfovibrio mexicanus]
MPQQLPKPVRNLGWISFFTDFASEMVYPVVPLFLVSALGAPVAVLGLIEGVAEAIVSVMKGLSGWHSDKAGKRVPYIRAGYGLAALSKPLMALAYAWPMVFLSRALDRLGKGLRTTARDAMIADAVDCKIAGRAFGFHRMMDTGGAIVGVLVALLLLKLLPGEYRLIFLIAGLPGLAAIWLSFRLRELRWADDPGDGCSTVDSGPEQATQPSVEATAQAKSVGTLGFSSAYWLTLGLLMLFAFANSSDTLLLLRARNLGWDDTQVIVGYLLFNLTYALSAYPLGILSDRMGRWRMLISGWVLYAAVYFGFSVSDGGSIWWLFPLYGLSMGLTEGVGKALISGHVPVLRKGTALGMFHMSLGFTALASSVVAGLLWDHVSPSAPFRLGGTVALAAVVAGLILAPRIAKAGKAGREG